jgi:hypothetical protein
MNPDEVKTPTAARSVEDSITRRFSGWSASDLSIEKWLSNP